MKMYRSNTDCTDLKVTKIQTIVQSCCMYRDAGMDFYMELLKGIPKPSLKIGTANAICWNSLGLFRDYGLNHIFFRNNFFLFFNFPHLLEKIFRETSQNFNSIRKQIEKMKIKIVWMSWMSWHFVRFHDFFFTDTNIFDFPSWKAKKFILEKNII